MKLSFLKSLIQIVESSDIEELEFGRWWTKVRITKSRRATPDRNSEGTMTVEVAKPSAAERSETKSATQADKPPAEEKVLEIKSPMVGIFYRAPSPGAKPYVEIGEMLQPGQVVCIIEAMKLMNEIESDVAGRLVKILVENAQPVEYGQALFLVSPS